MAWDDNAGRVSECMHFARSDGIISQQQQEEQAAAAAAAAK
jgi:hypothetical protein